MTTNGWYPKAKRLPITTDEYSTRITSLIAIIDHITDGDDSRDWLQHARNDSSVHFLIRGEGGVAVVYQFMSIFLAAWGNGRYSKNNPFMPAWARDLVARGININHATVSIEHERDWPFSTVMDGPMLEASIDLHKWLDAEVPTIIADREHVAGHYQIDHILRAHCPGGPGGKLFPFDTIIRAMRAQEAQNAPAVPTPIPVPLPAGALVTPFHRPIGSPFPAQHGGAIADFWNGNPNRLRDYGWPIKDERKAILENGQEYTVQEYERVWLHWRPGEDVGVARLGVMYQQQLKDTV